MEGGHGIGTATESMGNRLREAVNGQRQPDHCEQLSQTRSKVAPAFRQSDGKRYTRNATPERSKPQLRRIAEPDHPSKTWWVWKDIQERVTLASEQARK
jgi:hypothetical protein